MYRFQASFVGSVSRCALVICVGVVGCASSTEEDAETGVGAATESESTALTGVCKETFESYFKHRNIHEAKSNLDGAVRNRLGTWIRSEDPSVPSQQKPVDHYKALYECTKPSASWAPPSGWSPIAGYSQDKELADGKIKGTGCVLEVVEGSATRHAIVVALQYPTVLAAGSIGFGHLTEPVYFHLPLNGLLKADAFEMKGEIDGMGSLTTMEFNSDSQTLTVTYVNDMELNCVPVGGNSTNE